MSVLVTADLHLTDAPRDADRWNLFPWIRDQVKRKDIDHVLILGDITDAKDRHSATLVNRLVEEISDLAKLTNVILLRGNHDGLDDKEAFFAFTHEIPNVDFVINPTERKLIGVGACIFLPASRNPQEAWSEIDFSDFDYIFCHQTFKGAKAENGQELSGCSSSLFGGFRGSVISGDIHVPQTVGKIIEYVGAPYRIHFGDSFIPRCMLLQGSKYTNLRFPSKQREVADIGTLSDLQKMDYLMGSQIKVRVNLKRSEYPEWPKLRKGIQALADKRGWELCGISLIPTKSKDRDIEPDKLATDPMDILQTYINSKRLNKDIKSIGIELLKEAM